MGWFNRPKKQPMDVYRDTPLRYLGYLGLFGMPKSKKLPFHILRMTCLTYIMSDVLDKTETACRCNGRALATAGDASLFHLGSSIILPNLVMSSISRGLASQNVRVASRYNGLIPVGMFLALATVIGRYIDNGVNGLLHSTYRKWVNNNPMSNQRNHIFTLHFRWVTVQKEMCDKCVLMNKPLDVFRETPIRYLGYMEIFRKVPMFAPFIHVLRMACITYIVTDTHDKTKTLCTSRQVSTKAIDVFLFHFSSSIAVPGVLFRTLMTGFAQNISFSGAIIDLFPVTLFVAMIPVFGKFIDHGTEYAMESSYRKMVGLSEGTDRTKPMQDGKQRINHSHMSRGPGSRDHKGNYQNFPRKAYMSKEPTDRVGEERTGDWFRRRNREQMRIFYRF